MSEQKSSDFGRSDFGALLYLFVWTAYLRCRQCWIRTLTYSWLVDVQAADAVVVETVAIVAAAASVVVAAVADAVAVVVVHWQ